MIMPTRSRQRMWIILAVSAGVAWLWYQEAGRRQLAAEVDGLKARFSAPGQSGKRPQDNRPGPRTGLEGDTVDWVALASKLKAGGSIAGGLLNENARLLAALDEKAVDELLAMLDQIAAADLSSLDRDVLERALVSALVKKAPGAALSRFSVPGKLNWDFYLGGIYSQWAKEDSAEAVSWLRKHVAAGGYFYPEMVSTPFFDLLESAPQTSSEVLASVPPEARLESLRCLSVGRLHSGGQKEWAEIVRSVIPESDRAEAISWPIDSWSDGDGVPMRLDQAAAYLETIGASEPEREACIMKVAGSASSWVTKKGEEGVGLEGFDRMREWVSERAPGMLEAATLRALEELATQGDFRAASERALEFHKVSGNDAYLCRVLDQTNDLADAADVRVMIERLSDPALQAKYREGKASILKVE